MTMDEVGLALVETPLESIPEVRINKLLYNFNLFTWKYIAILYLFFFSIGAWSETVIRRSDILGVSAKLLSMVFRSNYNNIFSILYRL